jgi:ABC-type phosphonate transport system ATPase subunit
VLDRGTLAALGTIDEVLDDPRHPYVMALAGALDAGHAVTDDLDTDFSA